MLKQLGESTKNFTLKEILFLSHIYVVPFSNFMQYFPLMSNFQWAIDVTQFLLVMEAYTSHFKKNIFFSDTKKPFLILIFDSYLEVEIKIGLLWFTIQNHIMK